MKTNILEMLQIHSNMKQYKMKEKIDIFYISQVIPRILTRSEHQRYIRKKADRNTTRHNPTDETITGEDFDDSDSDDDKFFFASASEFKTNDRTSHMDRKIFITFIRDILSTIKELESSEALFTEDTSHEKPKPNNPRARPRTETYAADSSDTPPPFPRPCLTPGCKEQHKNIQGNPSNSLTLCSVF